MKTRRLCLPVDFQVDRLRLLSVSGGLLVRFFEEILDQIGGDIADEGFDENEPLIKLPTCFRRRCW